MAVWPGSPSRANAGAPGVDGTTFAALEAMGRGEWLAEITKDFDANNHPL
jgi:hypothetical protein